MSDYFPPKPEANILERVAKGLGEGVCDGVTSPVTIVKGAIDRDPRKMLVGALDAAGMVEVVGSPATYAGRAVLRESIGNKIQEKGADWLREQGIAIPQTMKEDGYDCLNKVFAKSREGNAEELMEASPQLRHALKTGIPGLY